jgi:hypothetical protein
MFPECSQDIIRDLMQLLEEAHADETLLGMSHDFKVPESTPSVPGSTLSVPESTPCVPESTPSVPESTAAVPESTPSVPESTAAVPESTPSVPESTLSVPESTPSVHGGAQVDIWIDDKNFLHRYIVKTAEKGCERFEETPNIRLLDSYSTIMFLAKWDNWPAAAAVRARIIILCHN